MTEKKQRKTLIQWFTYQGKVFKKNWGLLALCMPCLIGMILFNYIPMPGILLAFKKYNFKDGLYGSPWVGLANFRFFFATSSTWYVIRNTVLYFIGTTAFGLCVEMTVSLLMFEINNKTCLKIYQTAIQFPRFMSWVIVGFISYAIFSPSSGVLNQLLLALGAEKIDVYSTRWPWPFIIVLFGEWKGLASNVILFYARLMGVDTGLYEAATIDGANGWQKTRYISMSPLTDMTKCTRPFSYRMNQRERVRFI